MSLRDIYSQHAHERQTGALVKKMAAATTALVRDIDIVNQRIGARGLKGLFSPLSTGFLTGTWERGSNTLSYTLVRDEVKLDRMSYNTILANIRAANRDWMLVECKSATKEAIEKRYLPSARLHIVSEMMERHGNALRNEEAYRALHQACADPSIDMRVELVVAATDGESMRASFKDVQDYFVDIGGAITATPRLQVRIYLDQPYRASTDAALGAKAAPAKRAGPAQQA